jgi:magnesium-transporting ATPase (P-type)
VCCVGSALQMANSLLFATADVGVAVEPLFSKQNNPATSTGTGPTAATYVSNEYSTNAISASLSSIASALFMQFETSPYVLTDVIREARNLMQNGIQMLVFLIGCNVNIAVGILASSFLLLPPLFSVLHAIVLMYFMFPVLVLPYLFTPYDPNIMTLMPVKNIEHLPGLKRFISYMFIRFVPNVLVCVGLFYLQVASSLVNQYM